MLQQDPNPPTLSEAQSFGVEYARGVLSGKTIFTLTGAGISTDSGIPDYRGEGRIERHPMTFDNFMGSAEARARYWARSYVGWSIIAHAQPNHGHFALAEAERTGRISHVVTQNVDRLHQRAGSQRVIDLHGRLDEVACQKCGNIIARTGMDLLIEEANPGIRKDDSVVFTPDGDAEVEATANFVVPSCPLCGGILKPHVVFFGESVPQQRVTDAMTQLEASDALLVAGSSLAVNSGLRFAKRAHALGKPIVIVNIGPTKADSLAVAKLEASTSAVLRSLFVD